MSLLYILQYETDSNTHESVVIGVYDDYALVEEAASDWRQEHSGHIFCDVKELNSSASWTNDQTAVR